MIKEAITSPTSKQSVETWPSPGTEHLTLLKTESMKMSLNKQQQNPNLLGIPAASRLCARRAAVASSRPGSHCRGRACANTPGLLWVTKAPVLLSVPQAHGSENKEPQGRWR